MATRERTYRGIFYTRTGAQVGLDFYAENLAFARDHASHLASHDAMHPTLGRLTLAQVITLKKDHFRHADAGTWFPLD